MGRLLIAAGVAAAGLLLFAQDKPGTAGPLVPVQTIVTVEARHDHNKNIPSLRREDFMVYEHQDRLKVTDASPGGNADLELFIAIDDASGSNLGSQLEDLRRFILGLPAEAPVGIAYMRNGTVDIVQNLTTNHNQAAKTLRLPLSLAGASPYLSLRELIKRWPAGNSRREVVLVTSGVDPLGGLGPINAYLDSAIEEAQRQGIVVYGIYMPAAGHAGHSWWRINWAQSHLAQIAEQTGGEAYMLGFGPLVSFAPYLDEIAGHLAHQYRVTLLMKPEAKAGLRRVRFATEVPNAELVAPSSVYVSSAQERSKK